MAVHEDKEPKQEELPSYLTLIEARKHFGVSRPTLLKWEAEGLIKTIRTSEQAGAHRRFDINSYKGSVVRSLSKGVCYVRANNLSQESEIKKQIEKLATTYPAYPIIKDYGLGENINRKGFQNIIKMVLEHEITEVIVVEKNSLFSGSFDMLDWVFDQCGTKIILFDCSSV